MSERIVLDPRFLKMRYHNGTQQDPDHRNHNNHGELSIAYLTRFQCIHTQSIPPLDAL